MEVAELEDLSPDVNRVVLTNVGHSMALLVEGELLEGGWQHRVLQNDVVLVPGMPMVAAVACVEHGRWEPQGTPTFQRQARGRPRVCGPRLMRRCRGRARKRCGIGWRGMTPRWVRRRPARMLITLIALTGWPGLPRSLCFR